MNYEDWKLWYYFLAICKGIALLNEMGLIHTDIRAEYIVLDERNKLVTLIDFTSTIKLSENNFIDLPEIEVNLETT